jgi:SAM-dependent methyltransferase
MTGPRHQWDERYRHQPAPAAPASFVVDDLEPWLEAPGRALDVAGGAGRNSLWLAERGWLTTLVDISPVAVGLVRQAAKARGVRINTIFADLAAEPLPAGPWDLILIVHYLQRDLFPRFVDRLAPRGLLAFSIATERNLERHERPPRPHLLELGEAEALVDSLDVLFAAEDWFDDDRHEARIIARKP